MSPSQEFLSAQAAFLLDPKSWLSPNSPSGKWPAPCCLVLLSLMPISPAEPTGLSSRRHQSTHPKPSGHQYPLSQSFSAHLSQRSALHLPDTGKPGKRNRGSATQTNLSSSSGPCPFQTLQQARIPAAAVQPYFPI